MIDLPGFLITANIPLALRWRTRHGRTKGKSYVWTVPLPDNNSHHGRAVTFTCSLWQGTYMSNPVDCLQHVRGKRYLLALQVHEADKKPMSFIPPQ